MGFAIGSPVGTRHDASYTLGISNEDFLETSSVLEISTKIRLREKLSQRSHSSKEYIT
jgi:hypothetical protein